MTALANRLDVHFVACAAAAGAGMLGAAQRSEATIVYSGVVNVPIPNTFQGIYLNVATATSMGAPFAGWDINPYYNAGALNFYGAPNGVAGNPNQTLFVGSGAFDGPASNLPPGTLISAASTFNLGTPFSAATGVNFPVGGDGILGFRFFNEGGLTNHYAWARIHNNAAAGGGVLVDYAWENAAGVGILAGAIPAPGSLALLALGAAGLAGRRRT
jgi:hypothetical protein